VTAEVAGTSDVLVVGGGIVGLAIARELKRRRPKDRIALLEKEEAAGLHASGRNSGVLHAGFYYDKESLKARFCRDGNRELRDYIASRGLPLQASGKLVVASSEAELPGLDELLRRGQANGVPLESVTQAEARKLEPRVKTAVRALFSPTTASADPEQVTQAMAKDAALEGIEIRYGVRVTGGAPGGVSTSAGRFDAGYVVNAAGLYADRLAHAFGFGTRYTILPFKGLYLKSSEPPGSLRTHVYPVPDPAYPFLGVHFTVTVDGHTKIGPTAMPAFWREDYGGLANFKLDELLEVAGRGAALMLSASFDFRGLAFRELRKRFRSHLVSQAARLLDGVRLEDYHVWGKPGNRAQLLDIANRKLVMDFVLEGDARSLHVLNAVSPAWTCALPFARHVADEIAARGGPC